MSDSYCSANLEWKPLIVFVLLHSLSGIFAFFGNAVVLVSIIKTRSLQTLSNFFLASLSTADLMVGLIINPLYITVVSFGVWMNTTHPLYIMENFMWVQSLIATAFSLAAVSIDRYIAVTRVFRYQEIITKSRCITSIVFIWLFSVAFASVTLFTPENHADLLWTMCLILSFGIPFIVIIFCYFNILKTSRYQARRIAVLHSHDVKKRKEVLRNHKATYTIAIIILIFVSFFAPNFVFSILSLKTDNNCTMNRIYRSWLWCIWVLFTSSAINPWIYAIRNTEFRSAMKRVLRLKRSTAVILSHGHQRSKGTQAMQANIKL
ncbi:beta-1 adrenergic receptor-like [Actinia tenebrosa]|uniref:Beta-1 adrenergic receptor-like n=1 Tax=Actinia tenebrosa TaxID=6105 RepID=A0A6P8J5B1_ACTTE|nr:beta-1 adrenergic receptor-like [Actinia tenebrosa]